MEPLRSDANTRRLVFGIDPGTDCIGVCVIDYETGDVLWAEALKADRGVKEKEMTRKGGAGWRATRITSLCLAIRVNLEMVALWPKEGDVIGYESPNAHHNSVRGLFQFVGAVVHELLAPVKGGGRRVLIHEINASTVKRELGVTARDTAEMKMQMIARARKESPIIEKKAVSYRGVVDAYKLTEAMCDAFGIAQTARVIEIKLTEGIKTNAYTKEANEVAS